MKNAITTLRIQNFKSIKDVEMKPRRVNIIIGEPNVGKSNILEAMSLLGGMFLDGDKFMEGQIRYDTIRNLFYDNDWSKEISVVGEGIGATRLRKKGEQVEVAFGDGELRRVLPDPTALLSGASYTGIASAVNEASAAFAALIRTNDDSSIDNNPLVNYERRNHFHELVNKNGSTSKLELSNPQPPIYVKKYIFHKQATHGKSYNQSFLRPPFGDNLMEIIQTASSDFRKGIGAYFTRFGLNLAQRTEEQKLEIIKNEDGLITSIPYGLIADTLQRIIFYLAAIESNTDSVLLFEEPEAHSHPEYVAQLGRRIVESRNNQFFIATHSLYLVTEILEEMLTKDELTPELTMFAAYYENYQTKVRQLSDEDILNIRRDGLDVFYNMARFVPEQ